MKKVFVLLALSLTMLPSLAISNNSWVYYAGYRIGNADVISDSVRIFRIDAEGNEQELPYIVTDASQDQGLSLVASTVIGQKLIGWWAYSSASYVPPSQAIVNGSIVITPASTNYNGKTTIATGGYSLTWTYNTVGYSPAYLVVDYDYIEYNLSYNANGGSGAPSGRNNIVYTNKVSIASGNGVSRTGYTFSGWTNDLTTTVWTGGETVTGSSLGLNSIVDGSNVVLRAKWTANTYKVKFNANGGTGSMSDQSFTYGTGKALNLNAFVRTGYTFNGWAKSPEGSKQYNNGQTVSNLTSENGGVVTLYAKWSPVYYSLATSTTGTGSGTVSLSPSGGSYTNGAVVQVTASPANGSTFTRWSDSVTNNPRTYTMTSNISVSAVFTIKTYRVTFKDYDNKTLLDQYCNHGSAMPHPSSNPSRKGYVFKGWLPAPPATVTQTAVYTAQYEANSYTVQFHSNYGEGTADGTKDQGFTYGTPQNLSSVSSLNFAKSGYTFAHWKERVGGQTYEDGAQVLNLADYGVVHLDAQWTPNAYTVKFDANGGTGAMADMRLVYDVKTNLTANGFSRTGYNFSGWATSKSADVKYANRAVVSNLTATANGTYTLYAKWTAKTYTVTLDWQGGTGGSSSVTATYDAAMPSMTKPTRTGYTFGGYWTGKGGSGTQYYTQAGASARTWNIANNTTLYAKWTANAYTVTLDRQGGTGGTGSTNAVYASAMPSIAVPTRTGYTFGGYWTETGGSGTQYYTQAGASARTWNIANNTTLYAKWTANTYTVQFDANSGSVTPSSKNVTYDATYGDLPTPTRTGYAFGGWYTSTSGGSQVTAGTKVAITAAQTLHAHWTANAYTVQFDANGGTGSMSDQSFTYDVAKNLTSNSFEKTGYSFGGWAIAPASASEYGDGQLVTNLTATASGKVTLYASWAPIAYTISFDGNGADNPNSMTGDVMVFEGTEAKMLVANKFEKMGYTFAGWATNETDAAAFDVIYTNCAEVVSTNLWMAIGETNVFFAVWQTNTYTVVFKRNGGNGDMEPQIFVYDQPQALDKRVFSSNLDFRGWATNQEGSVVFDDQATVSNLTFEAGGVVTLYAVWDNGDLSDDRKIRHEDVRALQGSPDLHHHQIYPARTYRPSYRRIIYRMPVVCTVVPSGICLHIDNDHVLPFDRIYQAVR